MTKEDIIERGKMFHDQMGVAYIHAEYGAGIEGCHMCGDNFALLTIIGRAVMDVSDQMGIPFEDMFEIMKNSAVTVSGEREGN